MKKAKSKNLKVRIFLYAFVAFLLSSPSLKAEVLAINLTSPTHLLIDFTYLVLDSEQSPHSP